MFCRRCGKAIPDDSNFCPYCGETVKLTKAEKEGASSEISETTHIGELSSPTGSVPSYEINNDIPIDPVPNENYPYGACSKCGGPLGANDIMICEKCVAEENQRKNNPTEYKMPIKHKSSNHHTGAIWLIAIFIISIVLLFGSNSGNVTNVSTSSSANNSVSNAQSSSLSSTPPASSTDDTQSSADTITNCGLELISSEGTADTSIGSVHITGEIKNNSGNTLSYAQIQFALYDKSGAQVGTALANTNGLEPDKLWKYDAIGMASNVDTFKPVNMWAY